MASSSKEAATAMEIVTADKKDESTAGNAEKQILVLNQRNLMVVR